MPQMAPNWWSVLFIIFITTYMLTMINVYFMTPSKSKTNFLKKSPNSMNWKW